MYEASAMAFEMVDFVLYVMSKHSISIINLHQTFEMEVIRDAMENAINNRELLK